MHRVPWIARESKFFFVQNVIRLLADTSTYRPSLHELVALDVQCTNKIIEKCVLTVYVTVVMLTIHYDCTSHAAACAYNSRDYLIVST